MIVSNKIKALFRCLTGSLLLSVLLMGVANRSAGQPPPVAPAVRDAAPATTGNKQPIVPPGAGIQPPKATATTSDAVINLYQAIPTSRTLDHSLAEAMDKNPAIIAAKAKVALAQAELSSAQLEVARQLVALWNNQQVLENAANSARNQLERLEQVSKTTPGSVSAETLDNAKSALIDAEAKASRTQTELRYVTGQVNLMARSGASETINARGATVQIPRGPIVEKIYRALDKEVKLDFVATPMENILEYLRDAAKSPPIMLDGSAHLEGKNLTLNLGATTLLAALQAMEDSLRELRFVVREYGILLTTRDIAAEEGFLPLSEFVNARGGGNAGSATTNGPNPVRH